MKSLYFNALCAGLRELGYDNQEAERRAIHTCRAWAAGKGEVTPATRRAAESALRILGLSTRPMPEVAMSSVINGRSFVLRKDR